MNAMRLTKKFVAAGIFAGCILSTSVSLTGCLTDDKKDTTQTTAKHTPWGPETTVKIAAQGNATYGSAVDLDTKKVMLSKDANAAQGTIDLVFYYSKGDLMLGSAVAAKNAGDVPLAANYDPTKIKDTQIARISTKPDDSQLGDSTFAQTPKSDNVFALESAYLVKTGEGKLIYINVSNMQGDSSNTTADLTISLSGI